MPCHNFLRTYEKKKKKKKKKSSQQQKQIIAALGQSTFGLAPMPSSSSTEAVSLYSETNCPIFDNGEKGLLDEILGGNIYFANANLLEVFMGEFYKERVKLIEISTMVTNTISQKTTNFHKAVDEILERYCIIQHIFLTESNLLKENVDKEFGNVNKDYYVIEGLSQIFDSPISCMEIFLKTFINEGLFELKNLISLVINHHKSSRRRKMPTVVTQFNDCIKIYEDKCRLLLKCSLDENFKTFCLESKTNLWIESKKKQTQINEHNLKKIEQLRVFIKFVFNGVECLKDYSDLKEMLNKYINSVTDIIAGKISKKSLANFMQAYKQYALYSSEKIVYIKSIENDPELLKDDFISIELNKRYSLELIDKWMSDLHEAICYHFYEKFNELGVSSFQARVERLHTMIHIARNDADKITRSKEDNSVLDPFINRINESIQKLTEEIEHEFHESNILRGFLLSSNGELVENTLLEELQKKPFQLTHLFSEISTNMKAHISGGKISTLIKNMNETLCEIVKEAKSNKLLDHWDPKQLKEKIQETILDNTLELCVYFLIRAEINNLCSEDRVSGFMTFYLVRLSIC